MPTARARNATEHRPSCCASSVCNLCPVGAKFTIINDLPELFADDRVSLMLGARVDRLILEGGEVTGVQYTKDDKSAVARSDLVVLGANGFFNPLILQNSGDKSAVLGKRLNEQVSLQMDFHLDGLKSLQGSTSLTGHGYMLYDGEHRKNHAACLMETRNVPMIRLERGRWNEVFSVKFIFETLPSDLNQVRVSDVDSSMPEVQYVGAGDYTLRGFKALEQQLPSLLSSLPIEKRIHVRKTPTESHILGTTVMGVDSKESVVDSRCLHHRYRNVVVLGSSTFPTCAPANPTLTICALSRYVATTLHEGLVS
jgi:choline dehydrogenase-like flavoprotein